MDWDKILKSEVPTKIGVEHLHFDTNNPRFTPNKRPDRDTDEAIVSTLASTADLAELVQSISTSGYINIEPLIVSVRGGKVIVLEGNRRLAAIKCLKDCELAKAAKISVPKFGGEIASTLNNILVYRVEHEDDARNLIGFKHINGPQPWDAYAKAQYAGKWLVDQDGKDAPLSLVDIANHMGDKHTTIHRMVTALFVLNQAEKEELYSIEDRSKSSFSFSHLYTALSSEEYTDYIGMARPRRDEDPNRQPVPVSKFKELKQLLIWLYGSKSEDMQPIVKSQNPDLRLLKEVLRSKAATRELEERGNLGDAVITATPKSSRFSKHLFEANAELLKSQEVLDGFDPSFQSELKEIAKSALDRAKIIKNSIDSKVSEQED